MIISQNLLPFLWQQGALGGRTFDVLITRLPIEKLHERLDLAHKAFPDSSTLNDFRAAQLLIDLENTALTKSAKIITPHAECAAIFNHKVVKLDWALPALDSKLPTENNRVLFPSSALGRKGAYEMRRLALELNLTVVITGKATEQANFWGDLKVEYTANNVLENIAMVVYPVYIEHQPRILLRAIATGLPVITTTACGLSKADNLTILPIGDYEALKQAVIVRLSINQPPAPLTKLKVLTTA